MIIAVGRRKSAADSAARANTDTLLKEWGSRMWTFPELLLAPGKSVQVFTRGGNLKAPMIVPKNQFAARVWTYIDPQVARQLIDHYLGNISLSRLELAVLALRCLYSRHTTEYLAGDQAYALMGLLRMRPQIDRTDSAFQAFSRLSLANDSDSLLERYICTLPPNHEQPWFHMDDAYQSSLWDITPYCQVAGIAEDDAIIIDGAWGVAVRWKSFYRVYWAAGLSWKRFFAAIAIQCNGMIFILAVTMMSLGSSANASVRTSTGDTLIGIGVIFLLLFLYNWVMTPTMTRILYSGKFSDVQAEMFGFEGYLNAPTIERTIFGGNFGRFSWSPNGSPLSRSYVNAHGETIGMDPCRDPEVRMKVENAKRARPGDMRVSRHRNGEVQDATANSSLLASGLHARRHVQHAADALRGRPSAPRAHVLRLRGRHAARHRLLVRLDQLDHVPRDGAAHANHDAQQDGPRAAVQAGPPTPRVPFAPRERGRLGTEHHLCWFQSVLAASAMDWVCTRSNTKEGIGLGLLLCCWIYVSCLFLYRVVLIHDIFFRMNTPCCQPPSLETPVDAIYQHNDRPMTKTSPFPTATPAVQSYPTTTTHTFPGNLPSERVQYQTDETQIPRCSRKAPHRLKTTLFSHSVRVMRPPPNASGLARCRPRAGRGVHARLVDTAFTVRGRSHDVVVRRDKPFLAGGVAEAQRQCEMSGMFRALHA